MNHYQPLLEEKAKIDSITRSGQEAIFAFQVDKALLSNDLETALPIDSEDYCCVWGLLQDEASWGEFGKSPKTIAIGFGRPPVVGRRARGKRD